MDSNRPARAVPTCPDPPSNKTFGLNPVVEQPFQVLAITGSRHISNYAFELHAVQETGPKCHFLQACDLDRLPVLDRGHEVGRIQEAVMGAAVQPRDSPIDQGDAEFALLQIDAVHVGDLSLTSL